MMRLYINFKLLQQL